MDGIQALDDGAAAHFGFQSDQIPQLWEFMQPAYYVSSYAGIGILAGIILVLFLWQGRSRSALIAALAFASAWGSIELLRWAVPRARPQDSVRWLGPDVRFGSYPSAGVFLFMLGVMLLGMALWRHLTLSWRSLYVLLSVLLTVWVCLSQLYLATSFVTDVIGGIAGATLIGWIAIRFMNDAPSSSAPTSPSDAIQSASRVTGIWER